MDAIRFYEREQLLPRRPRTNGGFRLFSTHDIECVRFIRKLQELGFSLAEVKHLLVLRCEPPLEACERVRTVLEQKLAKVRYQIEGLRRLETELKDTIGQCVEVQKRSRNKRECCPVLQHGV